jgi:conjugal transfer pilus assembly protein TraK
MQLTPYKKLVLAVLLACGNAIAQTPVEQPTFTITFGGTAPAAPKKIATPELVAAPMPVAMPAAMASTTPPAAPVAAPAVAPVASVLPSSQPLSIARPVQAAPAAGTQVAPAPVVQAPASPAPIMPGNAAPAAKSEPNSLQRLTEGRFPAPAKPAPGKELAASAPEIITVRHGITSRVEVSENQPNLISTPFRKPRIIDNDKIAQARPLGADVFVMPSRETTIFIKDSAQANSPVVGIHLVPQRRPGRAINLVMDGSIPADRRETTDWGIKPSDYVDGLRATMKSAATNDVPLGYTTGPLSAPMAVSGTIAATPVARYAGSDSDIYRYRLTNNGQTTITLTEEAFASDRVKAVTIFPNLAIGPGQSTEVFIMFAKEDLE